MPNLAFQLPIFLLIWPPSGSLSSLSLMSEDVLPPSSFNRPDSHKSCCFTWPLLRERVTLWLGNSASPTLHGLCGWVWLHPMLGSAVVRILRPPTLVVSHSHSSQSSGKTRQTETKRLRGQKTYKSFSCHHSHRSVPPSYHTVNSTHFDCASYSAHQVHLPLSPSQPCITSDFSKLRIPISNPSQIAFTPSSLQQISTNPSLTISPRRLLYTCRLHVSRAPNRTRRPTIICP
jgi:hypothetical protein